MQGQVTRRSFLAGASTLASFPSAGTANPAPADRPNILVIMADDMGFSDLGCYGSEVRTPVLDGLARRGVRWTQFYNAARCCPTRASLLTGLYPHQAGVGHMVADWKKPGYRGTLGPQAATVAELLGATGYRCYASGKWHVASEAVRENWPLRRGFHKFFGTLAGGGNYFHPSGLVEGDEVVTPPDEGFYYTDEISKRAASFITTHREEHRDKPFFLYVAYTAPHWPLHALDTEIRRYRDTFRSGWDRIRQDRWRRQVEMDIVDERWGMAPRDAAVPAWKDAPHRDWEAHRMAVYAAQIDRMDAGIGRVLDQLEKSGQLDNTLVLFIADNGSSAEILKDVPAAYRKPFPVRAGNHPTIYAGPRDTYQSCGPAWAQVSNTPFRRYKMWTHEGGIATPAIAAWGKRVARPNSLHRGANHVIDILPTCLEAAGVQYPRELGGRTLAHLPGRSFLSVLDNKSPAAHEELAWEHQGNRAIRQGDWKLVSAHGGSGWELYNLRSDRTELHDLAATNVDQVKRMANAYARWAERYNVLPWPVQRGT